MKTSIGSYLIIQITGFTGNYIAEVVEETPRLILKVQDSGPLARLKSGDYIIYENESARIQDPEQQIAILSEAVARKHPYLSGLASLKVNDDTIREILPDPAFMPK